MHFVIFISALLEEMMIYNEPLLEHLYKNKSNVIHYMQVWKAVEWETPHLITCLFHDFLRICTNEMISMNDRVHSLRSWFQFIYKVQQVYYIYIR